MRLAFVISAALALGGCADREVQQLAKVKDEVCACKTSTCAEEAMKTLPEKGKQRSHRATLVAREMMDCLDKLYQAEAHPPEPQ